MKNLNLNANESQEVFNEIVAGGNIDIRQFLIEGMSELLNRAFLKEREFYFSESQTGLSGNKANGFSKRSVNFATNSIPIAIPRDRFGEFYPSILPKYGRNISDEYSNILESIILNSKSFRSIEASVKALNLPYSKKQVEEILADLFEEAKRFNNRQLDSDFAFIYIDAKAIDMAEDTGSIRKAVHFTVLGVNMNCKKEVLLNTSFFGSENLEIWKKVINNLRNRGLARVLMIITDDFAGLNKLLKQLFPNTDHQLCLVHLTRNLKGNLDKEIYEEFSNLLQEIYLCPSFEAAYDKLNHFIDNNIAKNNSFYAKYLKERTDNYLAFCKYPQNLRPVIRSTNAVEGINNAIEIARRNSGGYFHSEREIAIKTKIVFDHLAKTKWLNPIPKFAANLAQINQMFFERFEE